MILYGKAVADAMNGKLAEDASALAEKGVVPTLAIVRVGERDDDIAYERGAVKRCESVGIQVERFLLPLDAAEDEILAVIDRINGDVRIHGCLLFRPLPKGIDETKVCNALSPEKDIDGISELSLAGVFSGSGKGYPPCTAQACIELLKHYGIELSGKDAVVVGRSLVIGKPVAMMLLAENATVTTCHSKTPELAAKCRKADVLIVAAGRAGLIGNEGIGPNTTVIDVGINVDGDGRLCGDVDSADAELAASYSPVPGGVGSVTTSVLCSHVIDAAWKSLARGSGKPEV
ncbi:MAG: bifunctional 5,10-methylenetetrahydrofolate dehydrogenase/5,10-methenyltetrahydrofolate cyclohydrolase [Clostridiales Family XIII bacterium]|jgi:methylenetetrahydrofolate dehydrogenase (NADP+)/methenyltetrahydrofolate cyclohydrolase|nr:bifunctional 5,10-methylenetetrahydrofolate dehydrogenase/5,10-methenyltetrahydrofolate cyclohydrolase [Clostridiales Family XIII bacterium]